MTSEEKKVANTSKNLPEWMVYLLYALYCAAVAFLAGVAVVYLFSAFYQYIMLQRSEIQAVALVCSVAIIALILLGFRFVMRRLANTIKVFSVAPVVKILRLSIYMLFILLAGVSYYCSAMTSRTEMIFAVVCSICFIALALFAARDSESVKDVHSNTMMLVDAPEPLKYDLLSDTQQDAYTHLKSILDEPYNDVSVSLTGSWGSGKTTVLKSLRKEYEGAAEKDGTYKLIWVDIEPWRYLSEEAFLSAFYMNILSKIDEAYPRINFVSEKMRKKVQILGSKSGDGWSLLPSLFADMAGYSKTPEELLQDRLRGLSANIIITIDDLERSQDSAIVMRALQAIHHIRAVSGDERDGVSVAVITLCDKDRVIEALPVRIKGGARAEYLERFFDREVTISESSLDGIAGWMNGYLDRYHKDVDWCEASVFTGYILRSVGVKTYRSGKKLLDLYIRTMQKIVDRAPVFAREVYKRDVIVMLQLKIRYHFIYEDIGKNITVYTGFDGGYEDLDYLKYDDGVHGIEKSYILNLINKYPEDKAAIKSMLELLFPHHFEDVYNHKDEEYCFCRRESLEAFFNNVAPLEEYVARKRMVDSLVDDLEATVSIGASVGDFVGIVESFESDKRGQYLHALVDRLRGDVLGLDIDRYRVFIWTLLQKTLRLGYESDVNRLKADLIDCVCRIASMRPFDVSFDRMKAILMESATPRGVEFFKESSVYPHVYRLFELDDNWKQWVGDEYERQIRNYYLRDDHDLVKESSLYRGGCRGRHDLCLSLNNCHIYFTIISQGIKDVIDETAYLAWLNGLEQRHPIFFFDRYTRYNGGRSVVIDLSISDDIWNDKRDSALRKRISEIEQSEKGKENLTKAYRFAKAAQSTNLDPEDKARVEKFLRVYEVMDLAKNSKEDQDVSV